MTRRDITWLFLIAVFLATAIWMAGNEDYPLQPGLDLQGGLQVLLEADVPDDRPVGLDDMDTVRQIISQRVNALGVAEPLVQLEGDRRVLVELPGIENPEEAIELIQGTALLEFVNSGQTPLPEELCIRTTLNEGPSPCESEETGNSTPTAALPIFETILTGVGLDSASVPPPDQFNQFVVAFELRDEASQTFEDYTRAHQGEFLTIVLDKRVISSPRINAVIADAGTITGDFTLAEAQRLALQLRYGSLPIPLRIESTRLIGATLGEESVEASIRAGAVGLVIVLLFMLSYYRLPGALADIALITYGLFNLAVFKLIPVTLTLPAIAGFLLSTGMAVDANILVFERMKEELRRGRSIQTAVNTGFSRAWTSIRDSNFATLVICFILWTFGRNFGASIVQGFALTLSIGVIISMFTAIIVTRTLVRIVIGRGRRWIDRWSWLLAAS